MAQIDIPDDLMAFLQKTAAQMHQPDGQALAVYILELWRTQKRWRVSNTKVADSVWISGKRRSGAE